MLVALIGFGQPASADTPPVTFTVDKTEAAPGSSVTLTMVFTNTETTNVQFLYQSAFQQTWATTTAPGLKYAFTSCTGDGVVCSPTGGAPSYSAPIAPGATRTLTMTYQIAADSNCGSTITVGFYSYFYYEYNGGANTKDWVQNTPVTTVTCP